MLRVGFIARLLQRSSRDILNVNPQHSFTRLCSPNPDSQFTALYSVWSNKNARGLASLAQRFSGLSISKLDPQPKCQLIHYRQKHGIPKQIRLAGVVTCKDSNGEMVDSSHVVDRFLRLGNGMYLRRIAGYKNRIWRKIMKRGGPQRVYRMRRQILCSSKEVHVLDKLVTNGFKQQRWTVSDPYAGYDEHVKFFYNPFSVPGVNSGKTAEKYEYGWRRYQDSLKKQKQAKSKHGRRDAASNRQKPLLKNPYFH